MGSDLKIIQDFPRYTVDRTGKVMNDKGKEIKPEITNNGYLRVSLSNEKEKHKHMSVHRLVATAFIPNHDNLSQVNHKNENKRDNSVENLEWCTPLENLSHSHVIEKDSIAKFTKVRCTTNGTVYDSIKEAAEAYNVPHSNIVACCAGRRRTCGGVRWAYEQ